MIITGLHGKLNLFKKSMQIDAHLWGNGTMGRFSSFGFDPIRQVPFSNTNSEWILPDKWLLHFEAKANVSGVIISYKINNILIPKIEQLNNLNLSKVKKEINFFNDKITINFDGQLQTINNQTKLTVYGYFRNQIDYYFPELFRGKII